MPDLSTLRALGSFPSLQITPTVDDSDLVSRPVDFVAGKHKMTYHGGPTIAVPKTVLIWCGPAAVDRPTFERFAYELVTFGYLGKLAYAGCSGGQWGGSYDGPALAAGTTVLDSALQQYLRTWLAANPQAPQPDGSTIYSLMLPEGVTVQFDGSTDKSCSSFCGYHSSMDGGHILYTVEPAASCNGCNQGVAMNGQTMVYGHEVAESASDPTGQGWYEDSTGMENGDIVAWIPLQWGPWTVQGYADPAGNNVLGAYVPVADPQPGGGGGGNGSGRDAALALADGVIAGYDAGLRGSPRSTALKWEKKGAQAVRDKLTALPQ